MPLRVIWTATFFPVKAIEDMPAVRLDSSPRQFESNRRSMTWTSESAFAVTTTLAPTCARDPRDGSIVRTMHARHAR